VIPWHLGPLHPWEQVLTIVLAFGPFLLLGGVIVHQRRKDAEEDARQAQEPQRDDG
jgi:hypothetical protein